MMLPVMNFILGVFLVAYLEPSQKSTMQVFRENSWRPLAVNYFRKEAPSCAAVFVDSSMSEPLKFQVTQIWQIFFKKMYPRNMARRYVK